MRNRSDRRGFAGAAGVVGVVAVTVILVAVPNATAVIGRASIDGTRVEPGFIDTPATTTWDVAVDAGHLYWTWSDRDAAPSATGWIARADLDGAHAEPEFIAGVGDPGLGNSGLAVNASHIYWSNPEARTIGRANLDGTGVDQSFITSVGERAFDVEADAGHVYWAWDSETTPPGGPRLGWIGRAKLDGTEVDPTMIGPISFGDNTALALDGGHLYWEGGSNIYRADLDGNGGPTCTSPVDPCAPAFITGHARDLAVDAAHIYASTEWVGYFTLDGGIGSAAIDGSEPLAPYFLIPGGLPVGMAIGSSHLYWTAASAPGSHPPETTITKAPKKTVTTKRKRRRVSFRFSSDVEAASFECSLDRVPPEGCSSPFKAHVEKGRHRFSVWATLSYRERDPTPAKVRFEVKRKPRR